MRNSTYEEFANAVSEAWEMEYTYGEHEYFYQRSGHDGVYEVYVMCDGDFVYHRSSPNMAELAAEVLALRIYDEKTAEEAEEGIEVQFES